MNKIPKSRPKQVRDETIAILERYGIDPTKEVALLGVRGYYSASFGKHGNDINVYDDALFLVSPDTYKAYNFNTDPARSGKRLAMLSPGLYEFYKGKHKGKYNALRPYPEGVRLPCTRDGIKSLCGATNIHRGGQNDTWSEGCQTIPEPQFSEAMPLIYKQMAAYGQKTIKYVLIDATAKSSAADSPDKASSATSDEQAAAGNTSDGDTPGSSQDQPPTPPTEDSVAVPKGDKEGSPKESYVKRKWKQITLWWGSVGGLTTVKENADTINSVTPEGMKIDPAIVFWVIAGVIVLFFIWFFGGWLMEKVFRPLYDRWLTTSLINANRTPTNQVIPISADKIAEYEAAGWTVVRRS